MYLYIVVWLIVGGDTGGYSISDDHVYHSQKECYEAAEAQQPGYVTKNVDEVGHIKITCVPFKSLAKLPHKS